MNVSKEEIVDAIKSMNLTTVEDVNTFTMAGSCCGKCNSVIEALLKA
jgi:NAD(P)H-nitrite reductase large subunit